METDLQQRMHAAAAYHDAMSKPVKILLNIIGTIAVALGILGIFLPLLPTTPFLLLASACYMKGSQRMHRWLLHNRLLGTYLRNIEERKGLPLKAKAATLVLLWISLSISIYLIESSLLRWILAAIGIGTSTLILCMKTLDRTAEEHDAR